MLRRSPEGNPHCFIKLDKQVAPDLLGLWLGKTSDAFWRRTIGKLARIKRYESFRCKGYINERKRFDNKKMILTQKELEETNTSSAQCRTETNCKHDFYYFQS